MASSPAAPPSAGRVILAGGSGFLGRCLAAELAPGGYEVIVLTRAPSVCRALGRPVEWDGRTAAGEWPGLLEGAQAVVNLTGRSINCRDTPENREAILASRLNSVRALGEALCACRNPPPAWVQTASLAIYGDTGDAVLDESAPPGGGFSADVCRQWEAAFEAAPAAGARKVLLRIGFVLGRGGGVLTPLARLARAFLGGTVGSGDQYISWLHARDLNEMFHRAIHRPEMEGIYNATGPNPVTNAEFMAALRQTLGRPWSPPVPEPLVRLGAWLMGTNGKLALEGRRCIPKRLLDEGFGFEYPDLERALREAIGSQR